MELGWVPVPQSEGEVKPFSRPTDLIMSGESMTKSEKTGQLKFSGRWDFKDNEWDLFGGGNDFAAIRATEPISIYSVYCKAFQIVYDASRGEIVDEIRSGYDADGDIDGFTVSQQMENNNGVVWNIDDRGYYKYDYRDSDGKYHPMVEVQDTENGIASIYFKPRSGYSPRLSLDFEHNWTTVSIGGSIGIDVVKLDGSVLNISYQKDTNHYKRKTSSLSAY
ncbi:hypothetical protein JNUCC42_04390 [Brevibacterium sp. JNUCC-42]|nr:hypothetical protein JNUCC42_04390 [Brevibacterium sp. JNUCC-42]